VRERDPRVVLDAGLLALLAVAVAAAVTDLAVVRPLAVLLALLLVPGGAVLTRLTVDDPAGAAAMAIGLSLAIETLVAAALAAAHVWQPWLLAAGVGGPAAAALALDLWRHRHALPARRASP
jgi:hypothetical protein